MLTVSQLNEQIKATLEITFDHVLVEGEVGSVTYHSSGHLYFSLKDETSTIRCVMWRSNVRKLKFILEKGERIIVDASVGVYVPRGEYQLMVVNIEPFGKGSLALAFEQLKKKLEAKGYFDKAHKKELPKIPKKIAIVTSLQGAALQDMLKVANKRWPLVEIIAIDSLVQGEGAKEQLVRGIKIADNLGVDIIIVGRGGGSQEDLWAFNEEIVAKAIFEAKTPIVSAVGHEVDVLISDFVADLRAPTPSAAMEMILPNKDDFLFLLDELQERLHKQIELKIEKLQDMLAILEQNFYAKSPLKKIELMSATFESFKKNLQEAIFLKLHALESKIEPFLSQFLAAKKLFFQKKEQELQNLQQQLLLNNPSKRVKEGFVEVTKNGQRVDICKVFVGDKLKLTNEKCSIDVVVESK